MVSPALSPAEPTISSAGPVGGPSIDYDQLYDPEIIESSLDPSVITGVHDIVLQPGGHIERTSPRAGQARIKIEGSEKASLRTLRSLLAKHPVGLRILHLARDAAVDAFLSDAAAAAAVVQPPSKEVAIELRDLFAYIYVLRQLTQYGLSTESPAARRAVEVMVASWDWDLDRVERSIERHVLAAAGAGVLDGDMHFANFLLERPECREVLRDAAALSALIRAVAVTRDAVLDEFERREWRHMPEPTVHAVVARVRDERDTSVEEAVSDELRVNAACLRRAAYNNRVRGIVIARYNDRHQRRDATQGKGPAASGASAGCPGRVSAAR